MPGLIVHQQLCRQLLRVAPRHGAGPLAGALDANEWNAFAAGCVLPDMGYYPGGDPLLTDLAHYVTSAELARALLAGADTRMAELFALGWVTHVLADALFHPLVNAATAELLGRSEPVTYAEAPYQHARVEMGWDAWALVRGPEGRPRRLRSVLGGPIGRLLEEAYRSVYGVAVPRVRFRQSEKAVLRSQGFLMAVEQAYGHDFTGERRGLGAAFLRYGVLAPIGAAASLASRRSTLYALTHPVEPSSTLLGPLAGLERRFVDSYFRLAADGFSRLPDYNLDTGRRADSELYAPRDRTLSALARLRSS